MQHGLQRAFRRTAAAILLAAAGPVSAGDLFYGFEAGAFRDSNVPRAQRDAGVVGDSGLSADASVGTSIPLGERDSVSIAATFRGQEYHRYTGLDSAALGATLTWRTKLGLGAYAPRVWATGAVAAESFADRARSGTRARLSLEAARRVSEALDFSGGIALDRFDASSVPGALPLFSRDVFTTRGAGVFGRADYALSEKWLAYAGLAFRRGDVVSSSLPFAAIFFNSAAIAADPTFGAGYFAYRLPGSTTTASAGASYATSERTSLNLGFSHEFTAARGGVDYRSTRINASFVYSY